MKREKGTEGELKRGTGVKRERHSRMYNTGSVLKCFFILFIYFFIKHCSSFANKLIVENNKKITVQ